MQKILKNLEWICILGETNGEKSLRAKKVIEGNLTDARKYLRNHESQRDKKILQKPNKVTLKELFDNWNASVGDVQNVETTQTSTRNLQRHTTEYFGDIKIEKLIHRQLENIWPI